MRAVLSDGCRVAAFRGSAKGMGIAGTAGKGDPGSQAVFAESALFRRPALGNESPFGQPATRGSADRAAVNNRLSEMEEPHGRVQSRTLGGGNPAGSGGSQQLLALRCSIEPGKRQNTPSYARNRLILHFRVAVAAKLAAQLRSSGDIMPGKQRWRSGL